MVDYKSQFSGLLTTVGISFLVSSVVVLANNYYLSRKPKELKIDVEAGDATSTETK